jgi:hypothetical protein
LRHGTPTALLAILVAAVPCLASGQGLGDAARKEKERRDKAGAPAQSYGEDDLATAGSKGGTTNLMTTDMPAPPEAPSSRRGRVLGTASDRGSSSVSSSTSSSPPSGGDDGAWRARAASLRQRVQSGRARVATAEKAMEKFVYGPPSNRGCRDVGREEYRRGGIAGLKKASCYDSQGAWTQERNKAANELDAAKTALAEAQRELDDLPEAARRAGALPGWIR